MLKHDFLMNQIESTIRLLARLVFDREAKTGDYAEERQREELRLHLMGLLAQGRVNEGEDLLFENLDPGDYQGIRLAMEFYEKLNSWSDEKLHEADFSRKEIEEGLSDVKELYGIRWI